jgi:uncharacterized RDD family membrane protein YckC
MSSLPAGWYKDPADPETQRYWDGEGWLGKAIPADATPPEGPPPAEEPEPPVAPASPLASPGFPGTPGQYGNPGANGYPGGPGFPGANGYPGGPGFPGGAGGPGFPGGAGGPGFPGGAGGPGNAAGLPPGYPVPPGYQGPPPGHPNWSVVLRPHGFALAGLGERLMARIIDVFAVLALNVVVNGWFAYQLWQEMKPALQAAMNDPLGPQPEPTGRMSGLIWTMLVIATLLWLVYEAPATGSRGQTLGKRVMQIKVVGLESPEPLGFGRAFRRWAGLGLWTPAWGCLGVGFLAQLADSLSPLFDPRLHQAIHDRSARTVVVALPTNHRPTVDATPGAGNSSGGER